MSTLERTVWPLVVAAALVTFPVIGRTEPLEMSPCVEALEQLTTLQTMAPVYRLGSDGQRAYLNDEQRPALIEELQAIIGKSCGKAPTVRRAQEDQAQRLHSARSPECVFQRDILGFMERQDSRTPPDVLASQRQRVAESCPAVALTGVWMLDNSRR